MDWFFAPRLYGRGSIPDDALPKAIAQREAMRRRNRYNLKDDGDVKVTAGQWVSLGPTIVNSPSRGLISGRITSLAIDPLNSSIVYVAAAGGGVWRSSNRGMGWSPLTDSLPSLSSGAVAVDPFSGEIWYGTGELNFCRDCYYGAGVYRSSDGGATWSRVAADTFLSSATSTIIFDRRNNGTMFIGRSTALWKSADNGQNWHAVLIGVVTDFALNPLDSNIAYAAVGNAFGSAQNGVYRSSDGGETWTRLAGGLPNQSTLGRMALAIDPSAPNTVYALISKSSDFSLNGLYRSRDGGNTWTLIPSLPPAVFFEGPFAVSLFNMMVRVDPTNPAVIYVGGADLYKSRDSGATWQNLHIAEGQHDVVFDPNDPQTFYLINNAGVWRSGNGGQSFVDLNNSLGITLFQTIGLHPSNPNSAVGATQDHGTIVYAGGFAWDQGRLGDGGAAFYEASNPQTLYSSGHRFDLFRSDDGGRTWNLLKQTIDPNDRVQWFAPFVPVAGQYGTLYFATHRVWWSNDQGNRFVPISGDLTRGGSASITALTVAPGSMQVLYAGTSDAQVQVTADGGRSWSPAAPLPNRFISSIAIHPENPLRAFVALSGFGTGHVFRTDDRGGSWVDISGNLPDVPVNAVLVDANSPETIYIGTDIGVFVLGLDGTWSPLTQGMPNAVVLGLSQNPLTGLLIAATHGRGAFALSTSLRAPRVDALINPATLSSTALAPGMMVNVIGSNLASATATAPSAGWPQTLGGTFVTVNGMYAPIFTVSPAQVTFLVPFGTTGGWVEVTVSNGNGQATVRVPRADVSPGIFQNAGEGNILHANGTRVSDASPAKAGEEVFLYGTGLGEVDQNVPIGGPSPSAPSAKTIILPSVRVGGIPTVVRFSGLAPGIVATYQVSFVVPSGLSGKVPVVLEIGGGIVSNAVLMSTSP